MNDQIEEITIEQDKFRRRLKEIRLHKRLSQTDLAKLSGLQPSAISHFECARRTPTLQSIHILCSALLVSPNDLLGWSKWPVDERRRK
jgi:transcriptional regulator with XRE-family HTH domain